MTISNGYCTIEEIQAWVGQTATSGTDFLELAVEQASRAVDATCGRRFYVDGSVSTRVYSARWCDLLYVDDISTTTGLVVKQDTALDGTFATTWDSTDYQTEPLNGVVEGLEGWPVTRIRAIGRSFPVSGAGQALVQVTGKWGWAAVPKPVKQVTLQAAAREWKAKDNPLGMTGFDQGVVARIRSAVSEFAPLLAPYVRTVQV